jgi:hypothetical protein
MRGGVERDNRRSLEGLAELLAAERPAAAPA